MGKRTFQAHASSLLALTFLSVASLLGACQDDVIALIGEEQSGDASVLDSRVADAGLDAAKLDGAFVDSGIGDTGRTDGAQTSCSEIPEACVRLDCPSENDETHTWVCFQRYRRGAARDEDFACGMVDMDSPRTPPLGAEYDPRDSNLMDPRGQNFQYNCGGSGQDYYGVISWCGTDIYTGPTLVRCQPNQTTEI